MCSKQITLLMTGKSVILIKADNFTYMYACLSYNLIFHFIFISALH